MLDKSIYLIGPMGSGKSTIGRLLSKRLECQFIDMDREIESRSGVTIAWIFDKEGEQGFRRRESLLLRELSEKKNIVIATGGGVVESPDNQKLIAKNGLVVFLETSIVIQAARTLKDKSRPLLQLNKDRQYVLQKIYEKRRETYYAMSNLIVSTDKGAPYSVIGTILNFITKNRKI